MNIGNLGRIAMAPHKLGMTRRPLPMAPVVTGYGALPTRRTASIGIGGTASPAGTPASLLRSPSPVLRYWRGGEVPALKNGGNLGGLKRAVASDPHGDTVLAQINPDEAAILKARGTSSTGAVNPKTGIRDFDPHSAGNNPGGAGNAGGNSNSGGGGGGGGGRADRDQQGYNGGTSSSNNPGGAQGGARESAGGQPAQTTSAPYGSGLVREQNLATDASPFGDPAPSSDTTGNATTADKGVEDKYTSTPAEGVPTDKAYWSAVENLGLRSNDYMDRDNTFLDNVGNKILGLASIGELDPTRQPLGASVDNPNANWGVDPLGLATTAAGIVTGAPLGTLYKGVKAATGWEGPMISFGGPGTGYQNQLSNGAVSPQIGNEAVGSTGPTATADSGNFGPGIGQATGTLGQLATPQQPVAGTVSAGTQPTSGTANPTTPTAPTTGTGGSVVTTSAGDRVVVPYTGDPYTYGAGPEWAFFNPESLPAPKPINAADGGTIKGEGDGQDDKIPALLSSNEHVIDAGTVAMAGRGDSDAGHRVIEAWKRDVRKRAGFKNPNKAPIMKSIGSLATMRKAA